jgi:hypothetical protein
LILLPATISFFPLDLSKEGGQIGQGAQAQTWATKEETGQKG